MTRRRSSASFAAGLNHYVKVLKLVPGRRVLHNQWIDSWLKAMTESGTCFRARDGMLNCFNHNTAEQGMVGCDSPSMFQLREADSHGVRHPSFNKLRKHFGFERIEITRIFPTLSERLFDEGPLFSSTARQTERRICDKIAR